METLAKNTLVVKSKCSSDYKCVLAGRSPGEIRPSVQLAGGHLCQMEAN